MIFSTLYVGQHFIAASVIGDEAHSDTGDRRFDRNTCIHERLTDLMLRNSATRIRFDVTVLGQGCIHKHRVTIVVCFWLSSGVTNLS